MGTALNGHSSNGSNPPTNINYGSSLSNHGSNINLSNSSSLGSRSSSDSSRSVPLTSSTLQSYSNGFKSIVGSGICAIPFAFRCSGWLVGLVVLVTVCIASAVSMHQLVLCVQTVRQQRRAAAAAASNTVLPAVYDVNDVSVRVGESALGFRQLGELCLPGRIGRVVVYGSLLGCQLGGNCAFLAFIASSLFSVLQVHGLSHIITHTMLVLMLFPFITMLSMSKTTAFLAPFSHGGNVALFVSVVTVLVYSATQTEAGITWQSLSAMNAYTDVTGAAVCVGIIAFSVCAHAEMMAVEADAADRRNFHHVITGVLLLITVCYALFALPVYAAIGEATNGNIMLNLKSKGFVDVVKIFMSCSVFVMYPLSLIPAVRAMDELFGIDGDSEHLHISNSSGNLRKAAASPVAATTAEDEATTLITRSNNLTTAITVNGSNNNSDDYTDNSSSNSNSYYHDDDEYVEHDISIRNRRYGVLLRVLVVAATCVVTILVDNYALIVALVGSIAGGSLSFVLPPVFYARLHWQQLSFTSQLLLLLQISYGLGLIAVGLFVALKV